MAALGFWLNLVWLSLGPRPMSTCTPWMLLLAKSSMQSSAILLLREQGKGVRSTIRKGGAQDECNPLRKLTTMKAPYVKYLRWYLYMRWIVRAFCILPFPPIPHPNIDHIQVWIHIRPHVLNNEQFNRALLCAVFAHFLPFQVHDALHAIYYYVDFYQNNFEYHTHWLCCITENM